jgi:hypothetical protein
MNEFMQFSHAFGNANLRIAIQNHKVLFKPIFGKDQKFISPQKLK